MRKDDDIDMSELEREFESDSGEDLGDEEDFELILEDDEERESDFEEEDLSDYAERFYELSVRQFESESEVDEAINGLMNEMERDFFFKKLKKRLKSAGKKLIKKGLKVAKRLPLSKVAKGVTQLARGNLKGLLGNLAKAGLGATLSAVPGGAAIMPALKSLGFEASEDNRDAWDNVVSVARESYDYLASNLNENADDPVEASRLAFAAFNSGLKSIRSKVESPEGRDYRVIRVRKGEKIVIIGE